MYTKEYYSKDKYSIFFINEIEKKLVPNGEQSPKVIAWLALGNQFEVVPFVPMPLEQYKAQAIENFNQLAFTLRNNLVADYKLVNALYDIYEVESPGTKQKYKNLIKAFRDEFYRLKGLVESATTNDEIDLITENYPRSI